MSKTSEIEPAKTSFLRVIMKRLVDAIMSVSGQAILTKILNRPSLLTRAKALVRSASFPTTLRLSYAAIFITIASDLLVLIEHGNACIPHIMWHSAFSSTEATQL